VKHARLTNNRTLEDRFADAREYGPDYVATFKTWNEWRRAIGNVYRLPGKRYGVSLLQPGGGMLDLAFSTRTKAAEARTHCILAHMAESLPLPDMKVSLLPHVFRTVWARMMVEAGHHEAKPRGGKWNERRKQAKRRQTSRWWQAKRERDAAASASALLASLPPLNTQVELTTVKLLMRLRRRYPHAAPATLEALARLDGGAL